MQFTTAETQTTRHEPRLADGGLTPLEVEVVDLFASLVQVMGLPKSVGQIYGLIYIAPQPLNLDDIFLRLGISKGSASQGLKFLRLAGAVRVQEVPDKRSDHYVAETGLRALAKGFLKEQIEPHFDSGIERLRRIRKCAGTAAGFERKDLQDRLERLENWHKQANALLPFLVRFLGK